jgi:hydrogenase/urease accessory protein HupE
VEKIAPLVFAPGGFVEKGTHGVTLHRDGASMPQAETTTIANFYLTGTEAGRFHLA